MKFRLFVVALLVAIVAVPAQAQGRRHRPSEFDRLWNGPNGPTNVLLSPLRSLDRGYGYGSYYGYQNNRYGYGRGRYGYSQPATQRDVRGWAIGQIAATAIIGGIEIHKLNQIDKKLRQPTPQTPEPVYPQGAEPTGPQACNATGEKVFVGDINTGQGILVGPGQVVPLPPNTLLVAWKKSQNGMSRATVTMENGIAVIR